MAEKLTKKQEEFAKSYLDTGNATKAVIEAGYDVKNNEVARSIGSENLTKPNIIEYLSSKAEKAASVIYDLCLNAENETVKLNASKDILDRAGYKPTDKVDHTTNGKSLPQPILNVIQPNNSNEQNNIPEQED